MKVRVTFKDPDGVFECIRDTAKESVQAMETLDDEERKDLVESRQDSIGEKLSKWIEYGEYLTVEFDTAAGTARVVVSGR